MDGEQLVALLPAAARNLVEFVQALRDVEGREICFVPLTPPWAMRLLGMEADAREYGLHRELSSWMLAAFRVIRGQRGRSTRAKIRHDRKRATDAPDRRG